jgi:hypothetical protein
MSWHGIDGGALAVLVFTLVTTFGADVLVTVTVRVVVPGWCKAYPPAAAPAKRRNAPTPAAAEATHRFTTSPL